MLTKMKKICIIILALIISLTAAAQSIDDKDNYPVNHWEKFVKAKRSVSDPKVHKSFLEGQLTDEQLRLALETPYVDTAAKIYDAARLLHTDEYKKLQRKAHTFVDTYNIDLVIVTINQNNRESDYENIAAEKYAMDFYEYNDFGKGKQEEGGYDGVILLVDMQNRDFSILDVGEPNDRWHIGIINAGKYINNMAPYLTAKEYYEAFTMFIDMYAADYKEAIDQYLAEIEYINSLPENKWDKYIIAERSESDLKVNKLHLKDQLTQKQQLHALATPYVDPSIKVYDAAGLFTDQEIADLQERVKRFIDKNGIDMVIVTVSRNNTKPDNCKDATEIFAMDFYDYNDFGTRKQAYKGYDGVILAIDRQNRAFAIIDAGHWGGEYGVAEKQHKKYVNMLESPMENKAYIEAINTFIDEYEKDYQIESAFPWTKCITYALLIAILLYIKELKRYKLNHQPISAAQYVVPGSFYLTKNVDELIDTKTTSQYHPPASTHHISSGSSNSSFRSSSGSSHRSSSGRSFGGGSGKF